MRVPGRALALLLAALMLAILPPVEAAEPEQLGVLIQEVCPAKPAEYVVLMNYGEEVDLLGYSLSDGASNEGRVTFAVSFILHPGGSVAIADNATMFSLIYPDVPVLQYSTDISPEIEKSGRFQLNNNRDDVSLCSPDGETDAFAYCLNSETVSTYAGNGWSGRPVGRGGTADAMTRNGADTNTSADWVVRPAGRSSLTPGSYLASVEPFTLPEDGPWPMVREIDSARSAVRASVYDFNDPTIADALVRALGRGVNVTVLIEGQPVSGMSQKSKETASMLADAGATVRQMVSHDSYRRYDNLHAKYLVRDCVSVVISSENWGSGLYNNRGWGAIVSNATLASDMASMFDGDCWGLVDVQPWDGRSSSRPAPAPEGRPYSPVSFQAAVRTVISPDFSESVVMSMVRSATERVLVQQLYLRQDWMEGTGMDRALLSASTRGAMVRVLLDSTYDTGPNQLSVDLLTSMASAAASSDLQAKLMPGGQFSVLHNKGLVVDDSVLISSINWGSASMRENREVGIVIESAAAADYFAAFFQRDWGGDMSSVHAPTFSLPKELIARPGEERVLGITDLSDPGARVEWDFNGDGRTDAVGTEVRHVFPEGAHTVIVTVTDDDGHRRIATVTVHSVNEAGFDWRPYWPLLVVIPIALAVAACALWRKRRARSRKA